MQPPLPKTPPPGPPSIICRTPSVYCGATDRERLWLDVGHIVFFVLMAGTFVGIGIAAIVR
jgi:hypothetical protein